MNNTNETRNYGNTIAWETIKKQIKDLSVDRQIEDLRTLLAEDWRFRLSPRNPIADN